MAVGLRGRAVRFQQIPQSVTPQDIINRGIDAEQELYGGQGPAQIDLPEDMQIIDGITDRLFEDVAAVNNFAQTMWANYRIDVTRPDLRNPLAQRANQQYLKMLSGLKYAGQALKESNKILAADRAAEREGKGIILADPNAQLYAGIPEGERFVNTEIDPIAMQSNYAYAKMTDDPAAAARMQAQVDKNREKATAIYKGAGRDKRAEIVAQQFQGPTYERDIRLDADYWRARNDQKNEAHNHMNEIENLRIGLINRDSNAIAKLRGIPGIVDVRPVNTGTKLGVYIQYKDNEPVFVSFKPGDSQYGGRSQLNDIIQKLNTGTTKVPSSILTPYFEEYSKNDQAMEDPALAVGFDNMLKRIESLNRQGDSELEDGTLVTADDKIKLLEFLDSQAVLGNLKLPNGTMVSEVSIDDAPGVGTGEVIQLYIPGEEDPIEINPTTAQGKVFMRKFLEYNSHFLLPEINTMKKDYEPAKAVGRVTLKGKNLELNPNGTTFDAKSITDEFEKLNQ